MDVILEQDEEIGSKPSKSRKSASEKKSTLICVKKNGSAFAHERRKSLMEYLNCKAAIFDSLI